MPVVITDLRQANGRKLFYVQATGRWPRRFDQAERYNTDHPRKRLKRDSKPVGIPPLD